MLETDLKKLTTAVTELTAAINSGGYAAERNTTPTPEPSARETTSDTAPAEASESAPTVAEILTPPVAPTPPKQEAPAKAEEKIPTKKQLVEKFIELAQSKDREVAVKLLADFGVAKLPELKDKSKWAPFIAAVDTLLAG